MYSNPATNYARARERHAARARHATHLVNDAMTVVAASTCHAVTPLASCAIASSPHPMHGAREEPSRSVSMRAQQRSLHLRTPRHHQEGRVLCRSSYLVRTDERSGASDQRGRAAMIRKEDRLALLYQSGQCNGSGTSQLRGGRSAPCSSSCFALLPRHLLIQLAPALRERAR